MAHFIPPHQLTAIHRAIGALRLDPTAVRGHQDAAGILSGATLPDNVGEPFREILREAFEACGVAPEEAARLTRNATGRDDRLDTITEED